MSARNEQHSTQITAQVDTLDEALAWVVQQVDRLGVDRPSITISPLFAYPTIDGDAGTWMFEVSVGAVLNEGGDQ